MRVCHRRDEGVVLGSILEVFKSLRGPIYPADTLEDLLEKKFSEASLSEALTSVIIPAFDTETQGPVFFSNLQVLISLLLTLSR